MVRGLKGCQAEAGRRRGVTGCVKQKPGFKHVTVVRITIYMGEIPWVNIVFGGPVTVGS
jgi:hypothetical protein